VKEYVIKSVGPPREFEWDYDRLRGQRYYAYALELEGLDEKVEEYRPKESGSPQPGEVLRGEITRGTHGKRIKVSERSARV
jgi:hypothetical protein